MEKSQFRELASAVIRHLPDDIAATETGQSWIKNPERLEEFLSSLRLGPGALIVSSVVDPFFLDPQDEAIFVGSEI